MLNHSRILIHCRSQYIPIFVPKKRCGDPRTLETIRIGMLLRPDSSKPIPFRVGYPQSNPLQAAGKMDLGWWDLGYPDHQVWPQSSPTWSFHTNVLSGALTAWTRTPSWPAKSWCFSWSNHFTTVRNHIKRTNHWELRPHRFSVWPSLSQILMHPGIHKFTWKKGTSALA